MYCQFGDHLLELFLSGGIRRQRLGLKRRIEFIPDGIHFTLEVAGIGRDGNHRILVAYHGAELATGTVTAKRIMGATPELKAISLLPINGDLGVGILVIRDLLARGLFDPFFRDQLLALPLSLLQIKLAELRDVFRAKLKAIAAE